MYSLNQVNKLVSCGRDPARSLPLWRGFLLIPLILVSFALSPQAQAQCLDGCDTIFGTFQGDGAMINNVGAGNSAFGWKSLTFNSTGAFNTAMGPSLILNTTGNSNTAVGAAALLLNSSGEENTAVGVDAMVFNTTGVFNGAFGGFALENNVDGFSNNAFGDHALFFNTIAADNTAVGDLALQNNDSSGAGNANFNTAVGAQALFANVEGDSNNAVGFNALGANVDGLFNNIMGFGAMADNVSGAGNVAVGDSAGAGVEGDFNIYIGAFAGPAPSPAPVAESETIRIGDTFNVACFIGGISGVPVSGDPVVVDTNGQLGTAAAGHPLSMKELLKERQIVQQLKTTTEKQAARIALQEGQIQTLTAALKQQAEQIQKVSAQLEMVQPAPRVVGNQ
jgi:hypothetical protein